MTESENIARWLSADVSKMVLAHAFWGIRIGKRDQKMTFQENRSSFMGSRLSESLIFGPETDIINI